METKRCYKCKTEKEYSNYYKDPSKKDGFSNICKPCRKLTYRQIVYRNLETHREKNRRYYKAHRKEILSRRKERYEENKHKGSAHKKVAWALLSGKLKRGTCEKCKSGDVEAHHFDYTKPLEVTWLCKRHHARTHAGYKD